MNQQHAVIKALRIERALAAENYRKHAAEVAQLEYRLVSLQATWDAEKAANIRRWFVWRKLNSEMVAKAAEHAHALHGHINWLRDVFGTADREAIARDYNGLLVKVSQLKAMLSIEPVSVPQPMTTTGETIQELAERTGVAEERASDD